MSWPLEALGTHVDLVMGQAPPGKNCNKESVGTVFVKAGEFSDRFPIVREWTTKPLRMAKAGDVFVCVVGATAGKVNDGIDCAIGRSVAAVRPRTNTIDHGYLYRFLQFKCLELRAESQGLAQGVITREMLKRLQIPLPPLEEQKRIAGILDEADALRRLRTRALDRLNTLGQSIFHEMFGDVQSNPRGFDQVPLGDLIKVSSGQGLTAKQMIAGDYPVYGGNGINGTHNEGPVSKDKIVIGRVGAYCGAVHVTAKQCWVTDNALLVTQLVPANIQYLSAALTLAKLNQYAGRAAQPLVSGSRIYPVEILFPPLEQQEAFERAITGTQDVRQSIDKNGFYLETLFASLQHRAFRGEL